LTSTKYRTSCFFLWGWFTEEFHRSNSRTLDVPGWQIHGNYVALPLEFLNETCRVCVVHICTSVCKILGIVLKCDAKW
jgi:hypothetical protein